jgi:hypothetical protein
MRKPCPFDPPPGRRIIRCLCAVILFAAASCTLLFAQNSTPASQLADPASPLPALAAPTFPARALTVPAFAPPPFAAPPDSILLPTATYAQTYSFPFQPNPSAAAFAATGQGDGAWRYQAGLFQPSAELEYSPETGVKHRTNHHALLFESPRVSGLAPGRQNYLNPFGPDFGDQPTGPAPLFSIRGALNQAPLALPSLAVPSLAPPSLAPLSLADLMRGTNAASGVGFQRQGALLPGGSFGELPRPSAATLFGTSDLGNGMIFSAGTNFGSHAAGAPAATLGNSNTGAPKHGGPAVALKLSF